MRNWLGRFGILGRFWKRFVDYAKVGVCLALIIFLFQTIVGGGPSMLGLVYSAVLLLGIALAGAAGVAAAHELRSARKPKDKGDAWRKQVPW